MLEYIPKKKRKKKEKKELKAKSQRSRIKRDNEGEHIKEPILLFGVSTLCPSSPASQHDYTSPSPKVVA